MDPDTAAEPTSENMLNGVELSEGGVKYLNVDFRHGENLATMQWRHTATVRWERYRKVPKVATLHYWAGLVGVLGWDWQLGGEEKGTIAAVIEISRSLGPRDKEDFDELLEIDRDTQVDIQAAITSMLDNTVFRTRLRNPLPQKRVLAASDASGAAGAGVSWSRTGNSARVVHFTKWTKEESAEDINVRETRELLSTAWAVLNNQGEAMFYVLGTDNTTAKAALNHGMYPGHRALTADLQAFKKEIKATGSRVVTIHIPGRIIAADAPSREAPLNQELCKATYEVLDAYWSTVVEDEKRLSHLKRQR